MNKFFAWNSVLWICLLYGLGALCWKDAVAGPIRVPFFCGAAFFLAMGFVYSINWLWTHSIFKRSRSRHSRRHSDRKPNEFDWYEYEYTKVNADRRRSRSKKRKRLRLLSVGCLTLLFLLTGWRFLSSVKKTTELAKKKEGGGIEIFLTDKEEIRSSLTPLFGIDSYPLKKVLAMDSVSSRQERVHPGENSLWVELLLRNTTGAEIQNGSIRIESDVPIESGGFGLASVSDTELRGAIPQMTVSNGSLEEHIFPLRIQVAKGTPSAGLIVTIDADNLPEYTMAAKVSFTADQASKESAMSYVRPPEAIP